MIKLYKSLLVAQESAQARLIEAKQNLKDFSDEPPSPYDGFYQQDMAEKYGQLRTAVDVAEEELSSVLESIDALEVVGSS